MSRFVIASSAALVLAAVAPAWAQSEAEEAPPSTQEIGAVLGLELGGRVTPGGLHVGGRYLYRLSERDWLESGVGFSFGGGGAECFRDRDDRVLCDHGVVSGFGAEVSAGIRRTFAAQGQFVPYAHAGVGLRLVSFSADDLSGLGVPFFVGGGVRAQVHERVAVIGGAALRLGPGFFGRDLGAEPQLSLAITGGAEFRLY